MGQGESRAENEAQRARDVGTAGQSGGQQGRHLGEAHRSAENIQTFLKTVSVMSRLFYNVIVTIFIG